MTVPTEQVWFSVRDIAKRYGFGKSTVYDWIDRYPELATSGVAKLVPPITGRMRVHGEQFDRWINRGNGPWVRARRQ